MWPHAASCMRAESEFLCFFGRTRFAQMTYMRPGSGKHAPGVEETTVVYVVDAWKVATQDAAVGDAIAKAKAAVLAEEGAQHELAAAEDSLTEAEQVSWVSFETGYELMNLRHSVGRQQPAGTSVAQ